MLMRRARTAGPQLRPGARVVEIAGGPVLVRADGPGRTADLPLFQAEGNRPAGELVARLLAC
jgi:hypothetical protein